MLRRFMSVYQVSFIMLKFWLSCWIIKLPHSVHSAARMFSMSSLSWSRIVTVCAGNVLFWFLASSIWFERLFSFCFSFCSFWPSSGAKKN